MAVPTIFGSQSSTMSSGSGILSGSFGMPGPMSAGQVLLVTIRWFNTATACTIPGWTQMGSTMTQPNGNLKTAVFKVKRGSTDPSGTVTFTGGTATYAGAIVLVFSGASDVETLGTQTNQTTFGLSHGAAGVTTALTDSLAVAICTNDRSSVSAVSSGWTLTGFSTYGTKAMAATGATGTATFTTAAGAYCSTMMVSVASQTVPAPIFLARPTLSGTAAAGGVLTVAGAARFGYSNSYQWKRRVAGVETNIGTNSPSYTLVALDSKAVIRCTVTAFNDVGNTSATTLGAGFYTLQSADIGHNITAEVTATNAAGTSSAVVSNTVEAQFQNTSLPTISGTAGSANTLTAVAGTYVETVTSRTYHWLLDGIEVATGNTFLQALTHGSRRITIREDVTGPAGSGKATSTDYRWFAALDIPFKVTGNPWFTAVPADTAVDSTATATWQGYLSSQIAAGRQWYGSGGMVGPSWSTYLMIVDSSMTRTPIDVVASTSNFGGAVATPTKNGDVRQHLAWCFHTKNGGVPTPPYGFFVAGGTDRHMTIYCHDTKELWDCWLSYPTGYSTPRIGYGGYIPDVTQFIGYFQDLHGGAEGYAPGTVDEWQHGGWGSMATNFPISETIITQRDLQIDDAIGHAIGLILPSSNGTARWPDSRTEPPIGSNATVPLGGIIRVDPTLDPATLTSTGDAELNHLRTLVVQALQNYGGIVTDSTGGNNFQFRFESVANGGDVWTWGPSIFNPAPNGFHVIMTSIPTSAWQVITPTYRTAGGAQLPTGEKVSTLHFRSADFTMFGVTIDAIGRATLSTIGGAGGQCYPTVDVWDASNDALYCRIRKLSAFGQTVVSLNSADLANTHLRFEIDGELNTIKAIVMFNNAVVGTTTSATWNPASHQWLRISVGGGNITFATSDDNGVGIPAGYTTFRTLTTASYSGDTTRVRPYFRSLKVGASNSVPVDQTIMENLNEVPAPVATSPGWVMGVL